MEDEKEFRVSIAGHKIVVGTRAGTEAPSIWTPLGSLEIGLHTIQPINWKNNSKMPIKRCNFFFF